jgi:tRNA-dihydrouridine synthase
MKLSRVHVGHPLTLAPLEEHTNHPFRLLMKQQGASPVCTEFALIDAAVHRVRDLQAFRRLVKEHFR